MERDRRNKVVSAQDTRAQVTREELLNAAITLVEEHGMSYLTVRNICDEAGLSTGSFYNLFSGKDELITYYLKHSFRKYKEKAQKEGKGQGYTCIEKVLLVYRYYSQCCKNVGLEFVSDLYAANNSPFFDFVHRDSEDELVLDILRVYLTQGKEDGVIRPDVDVEQALLHIAALATGIMFYWCVFKGQFDVSYQMDELLRTYLLSLATDPNMELQLEPLQEEGSFLEVLEGNETA